MVSGKHLVQRGKQQRYYLRLAVPRSLQKRWNRRERIKALGTSDRALAERLALPILAQWREEERTALGQSSSVQNDRRVPTERELEDAAVLVGHDLVRDDAAQARRLFRSANSDVWDGQRNYVGRQLEEQKLHSAAGDLSLVVELADEIADVFPYKLDLGSPEYIKLCELLNAARLAALKVNHAEAHGELEGGDDSPLVRRVRDRETAKAKSGETILDLFERWAAERMAKGKKGLDTVNQDRKKILQFAEFVGKDRAIGSITPLEVAEYRDILRDLPPKWSSNKKLRELPIRAAASEARRLRLAETAFTTVNSHLSVISPLYKWLMKEPARAGMINPCDGLFHDDVKGQNPRPPFTTDDLNKMFKSPLFTGFLADGKEHMPGNMRAEDWRFWMPLICMATGARIGEIAQLRVGDIRKERGVWFIHIRHEESEGLSTKNRKSRAAPMHSMLEPIGFLKFHAARLEAVGDDPTAALFPELKPNSRDQISGMPSRWWRDYLADIGVKEGSDGMGSHSFRHTLADRLRSEAELLDVEIAVLFGHGQKTTTTGYGRLSQGTVTKLKGWIDAVTFDGVDFSHLAATVLGETT